MGDEYLKPEEIAERLRVSSAAVREWCRLGKLRAQRVGRQWRIQRADLESFLEQRSTGDQASKSESVVGITDSLPVAL